jgi:hypothetical protein
VAALGAFAFILFLAVAIVQAVIGYIGIEHYFGTIAAVIALAVAFSLRITLPLTIGTFFGALEVLGWPWYLALVITVPGLLFAAPAMIAAALDSISPKR